MNMIKKFLKICSSQPHNRQEQHALNPVEQRPNDIGKPDKGTDKKDHNLDNEPPIVFKIVHIKFLLHMRLYYEIDLRI